MRMYLLLLIFGTFSCIYLTSCNNSTGSLNPEDSKVDNLIDHKWVLYSWESEDGNKVILNQNETYYLIFNIDSSFTGLADCNSIVGNYKVKDGGYIKIGSSIATTYIYCGSNSHDRIFLRSLVSANIYEVNSTFLRLDFGSKGKLDFFK